MIELGGHVDFNLLVNRLPRPLNVWIHAKNKFARVVIATADIDERVNGNGIKKLREAGIDVVCGVLEKEAQEINRGFFTAKKLGRPFVTLKLATSLDGKIATKNYDSKWITSKTARNFSHLLRAKNDAILVGANTAKYDNPQLNCRLPSLLDFINELK